MTASPTPLRRDAARNRDRILTVAAEVFAARGVDTSMEEIAAAVGVGVGTLYRHFGSKGALLEAVFANGVDAQLETMLALGRGPSAWDGLCAVLRHLLETQLREPGTMQMLYARVDAAPDLLRARVEPVLTELVTRAKAEGSLREDFAATDVPIVTAVLSRLRVVPGHGPGLARRYLELFLKGLARTPDPSAVPAPLPDDAFATWFRTAGGAGA